MKKCHGSFNYKLDKPPKYQFEDTGTGIWKTFEFENGVRFAEYTSHFMIGDQPFLSITSGPDPETGKAKTADGFVAIGQFSKGFLAMGQFCSGYFAIGQFATARIAGVGQFIAAPLAIGQFSIAVAAIAQMGIVGTGIMQAGLTVFGGLGQMVSDLGSLLF